MRAIVPDFQAVVKAPRLSIRMQNAAASRDRALESGGGFVMKGSAVRIRALALAPAR